MIQGPVTTLFSNIPCCSKCCNQDYNNTMMDKQNEDRTDPIVRYRNGLDPLSRQSQERYGKGVTPIRSVSVAPRHDPEDTIPRGPVGPPGGTLPNHRLSPRGAGGQAGDEVPRGQVRGQVGQVQRKEVNNGVSSNKARSGGNMAHGFNYKSGVTGNPVDPYQGQNRRDKTSPPQRQQPQPQQKVEEHTYENAARLRLSTQNQPAEGVVQGAAQLRLAAQNLKSAISPGGNINNQSQNSPHNRLVPPQYHSSPNHQAVNASSSHSAHSAHAQPIYENTAVHQRQAQLPPYSSSNNANRNNNGGLLRSVGGNGNTSGQGQIQSRNQPQPQAPSGVSSQQRYMPSSSVSPRPPPANLPPYIPSSRQINHHHQNPNPPVVSVHSPHSITAASLSPALSEIAGAGVANSNRNPGTAGIPVPPYRGIERHVVPEFKAPQLDFETVRIEHLSSRRLYEDPEFPAEDTSLYYSRYPPYKMTWMRPKDIAAQYRLEAELFVEGTSRFDLQQGELGDCWLLAAAACMSEEPKLLEEVLPSGQSFHANWYAGMFRFRFWHNAEWREVVIDDRLPTDRGRLMFVHSGKQNEFWGALLEKAYAKLFGSYEALKGGHVADALIDFTGGIAESYNLKTRDPPLPSNLSDIVAKALEQNCLVGCGIDPVGDTQETVLPNGLVCGHAYSITDLKQVPLHTRDVDGQVKLVRVRNPWGTRVEWSGAWSDRSKEWTSIPRHERQTLGLVFRDDGEFWMEWNDFLSHFHNIDLCYPGPNTVLDTPKAWSIHTFHGRWRPGVSAGGRPSLRDTHWTNPQYRVILTDHDDEDSKCSFVLELMQKDRRKMRYKGLEKVTMGFVIYQLSKSYKLPLPKRFFDRHWFTERCDFYTNARQITKRFLLDPGEYLIVPSTYDADVAADFSVRVFFEKENKALDTDEPTEIVDPDPPKPDPSEAAAADQLTEFQKLFHQVAGQDMEVDAYELHDVINKGLSKDPHHKEMSVEACKSMLALVDVSGSGKLDFYEFRYLWDMLSSWRRSFYQFDKNKSGYINGYELKQAVAGQGYRLSAHVLSKLMTRYSDKEHHIDLDNFICCMAKMLTLFNVFKQNHENEICSFTLNNWLEVTIAL